MANKIKHLNKSLKFFVEDSDISKLKEMIEHVISKSSMVTRTPHQDVRRYEVLNCSYATFSLTFTENKRLRIFKN